MEMRGFIGRNVLKHAIIATIGVGVVNFWEGISCASMYCDGICTSLADGAACEASGRSGWRLDHLVDWMGYERKGGPRLQRVEGTYAGAGVKHSRLQKRLYIEQMKLEVADRWRLHVLPPRGP